MCSSDLTLPSSLRVGTSLIAVPANTPIRRGGTAVAFSTIAAGDRVEIHAVDNAGTLTATEIQIESSSAGTGSSDDGANHDSNDDKGKDSSSGDAELKGAVTAIVSRSCPSSVVFTLGGITVTADAQTRFDDTSCAALTANMSVEVKGSKTGSTTMLATRVERK